MMQIMLLLLRGANILTCRVTSKLLSQNVLHGAHFFFLTSHLSPMRTKKRRIAETSFHTLRQNITAVQGLSYPIQSPSAAMQQRFFHPQSHLATVRQLLSNCDNIPQFSGTRSTVRKATPPSCATSSHSVPAPFDTAARHLQRTMTSLRIAASLCISYLPTIIIK